MNKDSTRNEKENLKRRGKLIFQTEVEVSQGSKVACSIPSLKISKSHHRLANANEYMHFLKDKSINGSSLSWIQHLRERCPIKLPVYTLFFPDNIVAHMCRVCIKE